MSIPSFSWPAVLAATLWLLPAPAVAAISPDQAAAIARQASAGRVLAVEKTTVAGREVYRVKVLTASREVRVVLIDADTGQRL